MPQSTKNVSRVSDMLHNSANKDGYEPSRFMYYALVSAEMPRIAARYAKTEAALYTFITGNDVFLRDDVCDLAIIFRLNWHESIYFATYHVTGDMVRRFVVASIYGTEMLVGWIGADGFVRGKD